VEHVDEIIKLLIGRRPFTERSEKRLKGKKVEREGEGDRGEP
jgi:hypothetical protein